MDCVVIDSKVALWDGSAVSVPPNHFDDAWQIAKKNAKFY